MIYILTKKILSLAIIMVMGALLVRFRVLRSEDSKVLSTMSLYLIMPCMILSAFQVDYTEDVKNGLLLVFFAAAVILAFLIFSGALLKKLLQLDAVEQTSFIYSNAGNLIIPLVTAMLGKEWVIYTSGLILVQIVMLFTHATRLLSRQKEIDVKKIFLNPNILAIIAGVLLFFTKIHLPGILGDTVDSVGGLIGPISMLVTGMIIGSMDLKQVFSYRRVWLITFLRLIAAPLCILLILRFSGIASMVKGGKDILLVTYLANTTPVANTITQLAQVHGNDAEYASAISVVTTIGCMITIPVMVMLYQL